MSRYGSENLSKFNRYELNVFVKKLRMIHTCHFPASTIKGNTARQLVFLLLRGTDTHKKKQIKEIAIDFNSSEGNNDHLSKHHGVFTEVVIRQRENAAGIGPGTLETTFAILTLFLWNVRDFRKRHQTINLPIIQR